MILEYNNDLKIKVLKSFELKIFLIFKGFFKAISASEK